MDLGGWAQLGNLAVAVLALGVSIAAMRAARSRQERDELERIKREVLKLEERVHYLPGTTAIEKLTDRFDDLSRQMHVLHSDFQRHLGKFEGFEKLADGLQRQLELMDTFLKDRPGR